MCLFPYSSPRFFPNMAKQLVLLPKLVCFGKNVIYVSGTFSVGSIPLDLRCQRVFLLASAVLSSVLHPFGPSERLPSQTCSFQVATLHLVFRSKPQFCDHRNRLGGGPGRDRAADPGRGRGRGAQARADTPLVTASEPNLPVACQEGRTHPMLLQGSYFSAHAEGVVVSTV